MKGRLYCRCDGWMRNLLICCFLLMGRLLPAEENAIDTQTQRIESCDFDIQYFESPGLAYAPLTRWWWPGNDVEQEELKRELCMFAEMGFGGVEIQPFSLVFPMSAEARERIMQFASNGFYENLAYVLNLAETLGLKVELTNGSGWPAGGPHISEDECNRTLVSSETIVDALKNEVIFVPTPPISKDVDSHLMSVIGSKVMDDIPVKENRSISLDPDSLINLTDRVLDGKLNWRPGEGKWRVIAIWNVANLEAPKIFAGEEAGYVMNHFDADVVENHCEMLWGEQTGLSPYYGKSLTAIFDDSYEFDVDRHFSDGFLHEFEAFRGYQLDALLPAVIWTGYNSMYRRTQHPNYRIGDEDWRIRYDYDLTLGKVLEKEFLGPAEQWASQRGMKHRTQPYGLETDLISLAGHAGIPETETMMAGGGTEAAMKLITSGAMLYNRPIVSCESVVYINRGMMMTPFKAKMSVDKIIASGVNQIIYHGSAYRYFPDKYPEEGWYPFMNPGMANLNFSSDFSEMSSFWEFMEPLNEYVSRLQYAMRSGKPSVDLLIYFPFLKFDPSEHDPDELLFYGYLEGIEPLMDFEERFSTSNSSIREKQWYQKLWKVIDLIESRGLTWAWVNDDSLQVAELKENGNIQIRENEYKGLLLVDAPYIQLPSAARIAKNAEKGANTIIFGEAPAQQPGYHNHKENDQRVRGIFAKTTETNWIPVVSSTEKLAAYLDEMANPVRFAKGYNFLKSNRRVMKDGSYLQFLWNTSDQWKRIEIELNSSSSCFWLDPMEGRAFEMDASTVSYDFPPFGSMILYVNQGNKQDVPLRETDCGFNYDELESLKTLPVWNLSVGDFTFEDTALFDWRTDERLRLSSDIGIYRTEVELDAKTYASGNLYLDMGVVHSAARLYVNGKDAGSCFCYPYLLNISDQLKEGNNSIEIHLIPPRLNGLIGKAKAKIREYRNFKKQSDALMASGLIGPVKLLKLPGK